MKLTKSIFALMPITLAGLFLQSCEKDVEGCMDPAASNYNSDANVSCNDCCVYPEPEGTFELNVKGKVDGQPFVLGQVYENVLGYQYKIQTIEFTISNVTLINEDGSEVEVINVDYLNFLNNHTTSTLEGEKSNGTAPAGNYTAIKFGFGLDSLQNTEDPNTFPSDHPLSVYVSTYWSWANKYIFSKLEGKIDSLPNGDGSLTESFLYHCGTDPLYKIVTIDKEFKIQDNNITQFDLALDINKLFYNETDTLDAAAEEITHTTDGFDLASRVTDFYVGAFTAE